MFARLYVTGREFIPSSNLKHVIKCTVNGSEIPFTVANDEVHSFGLFDSHHRLIGYFGNNGLTQDTKESVHVDGFMEPTVKDAPKGCYIKSVSVYYKTSNKEVFSRHRTLH